MPWPISHRTGRAWQYAATIGATAGWTPGLVKGSDYGFVVAGTSAAGQLVAYTADRHRGDLAAHGAARQCEPGVGGRRDGRLGGHYRGRRVHRASSSGQQPVFLEANAAGHVQPVSLASLPGGSIPELAVNGLAAAAGQQIAVGSANGYPAVWRRTADGSWALVTSLTQASGNAGLTALTGVTHGSAGWLAVGTPGPGRHDLGQRDVLDVCGRIRLDHRRPGRGGRGSRPQPARTATSSSASWSRRAASVWPTCGSHPT